MDIRFFTYAFIGLLVACQPTVTSKESIPVSSTKKQYTEEELITINTSKYPVEYFYPRIKKVHTESGIEYRSDSPIDTVRLVAEVDNNNVLQDARIEFALSYHHDSPIYYNKAVIGESEPIEKKVRGTQVKPTLCLQTNNLCDRTEIGYFNIGKELLVTLSVLYDPENRTEFTYRLVSSEKGIFTKMTMYLAQFFSVVHRLEEDDVSM